MDRDQEANQRIAAKADAELRYYRGRPVLVHSRFPTKTGEEALITNLKGTETNIVPARTLKKARRVDPLA